MINKNMVINGFKNRPDEFSYNEENDTVTLFYEDGKTITVSVDDFIKNLRKHNGESFKTIYYDRVSLSHVIECTECHTVIFSYDNDRFDKDLKCPTCTDYKPYFEYWTKEEIETDDEKQNTIDTLNEMTRLDNEAYERMKRRHGKTDKQLIEKKFYGKRRCYLIYLNCDDVTKSHIKGLHLEIRKGTKDEDGIGYIIHSDTKIPLGVTSLVRCVKHRKQAEKKKGE